MGSSFAARAGAWLVVLCALALLFFFPTAANALWGFYVGKADAVPFNEASQVVMVRRDDRTVINLGHLAQQTGCGPGEEFE